MIYNPSGDSSVRKSIISWQLITRFPPAEYRVSLDGFIIVIVSGFYSTTLLYLHSFLTSGAKNSTLYLSPSKQQRKVHSELSSGQIQGWTSKLYLVISGRQVLLISLLFTDRCYNSDLLKDLKVWKLNLFPWIRDKEF